MTQQPTPPLEELTLRQLRLVASEYNVSRYSRMRKDQLIAAIKEAQQIQVTSVPAAPQPVPTQEVTGQEAVEATKFNVGSVTETTVALADVDENLGDLPDGYGESRVVLLPRDPQWAYVYWDIPNSHKEELRRQGGIRLALRFYDVTNIDVNSQRPHSMQQYECDELAREWYLPVPVSDRDYCVEIGYLTMDGRWLMLTRSAPVHTPPVYPSDWVEDQFLTIGFEEELRGKTFAKLVPPEQRLATAQSSEIYDTVFDMAQSVEAQRVAGSLFGSMHQVPQEAISSFIFPSGAGLMKTASGAGLFPGVPAPGALTTSGMGMGVMGLTMSGAGVAASMSPARPPRKFWLVADAELIVYGATEPDATVTIGGQPIKLNPDGTFRFQMSFQDGVIDYPILAVASDGEQNRAIHMTFNRETPERRTNTKEEAVEEWLA